MPFRQAHTVVTKLTDKAAASGKYLRDLSLDDYRAASDLFEEDVLSVTVDSAVAARDVPGGTAPARVAGALKAARDRLAAAKDA